MSATLKDQVLWEKTVCRLTAEWQGLAAAERHWIVRRVRRIGALQNDLHQLFLDAGGAETCGLCRGECCGHGRFHPTLVNLLLYLVDEQPIPSPDFAKNCPYGDASGCLFPPPYRPYNCISFICERIEARLGMQEKEAFYRLEREIRATYEAFADRYAGGNLHGLLLRGIPLPAYLARRQSPS